MQQFADCTHLPRLVMPPFDYAQPLVNRGVNATAARVLQIVGVQTYRKNIVFATGVAKALKLLGHSVRLDIIGRAGTSSAQLKTALTRRGIDYRVHPHLDAPYAQNQSAQVITLVCSTSEPYGLTVPESLRLGIPVVSSDCGGPSELLPHAVLYPVDDVDACVRILLSIWGNYLQACQTAHKTYQQLEEVSASQASNEKLDAFMQEASSIKPASTSNLSALFKLVRCVSDIPFGLHHITQSIASVATQSGLHLTAKEVGELIDLEQQHPGVSVMNDIHNFDVIPFGNSNAMARLYQEGFGLAMELAANFSRPERLQMIAFIVCGLWQETRLRGRPLTVLALGDGIGLDSIRLAHAGFNVDYMDYEGSKMARIASENFSAFAQQDLGEGACKPRLIQAVEHPYDVVVCLEVIEHVSEPNALIAQIAEHLVENGLVFISECFNGIEDRWPTHLAANEKYAGMLPFMMDPLFRLETLNRQPYGKPYVFRKRGQGEAGSATALLSQRGVMAELVRQQLSIGL